MQNGRLIKKTTLRATRSVDIYLHEISGISLLSTEEESELLKQIKKGNQTAYKKLIESNLRFVVSVAKQYQNQGLLLIDLISEGNLGLMIAAEKFDASKGFKFISYAIWWIRQYIILAISKNRDAIRLPANKINLARKIYQIQQNFEKVEERPITFDELCEISKTSAKNVKEILSLKRTISADSPIPNTDENITIWDLFETVENIPDKDITNSSQRSFFNSLLHNLKEKEKQVLIYYYGLDGNIPLTYGEIGLLLEASSESIRITKKKALDKLQKALHNKDDFFELYS